MKRLFLGSVLVIAMAACVDPASDPPPSTPSSEVSSQELAASSEPASSADRPPVTTQVAGVWNNQFMDLCRDWFLQYCFADFPAPQCPAAPDGKSCSPVGSFCYKTVNRQNFRYYTCD